MSTGTSTKERPILMAGPMALAAHNGTKTQTRRPVKPQRICDCPVEPEEMCNTTKEGWQTLGHSGQWWCPCCSGDWQPKSPFGAPGEKLWVRETFDICTTVRDCTDEYESRSIDWKGTDEDARREGVKSGEFHIAYRADGEDGYCGQWKPSIHMPRWASRTTLENCDVRLERVKDITEADAIAEGFKSREEFFAAWDEFYGDKLSVRINPWVWVYEFKKVTA